MAKASELRAKDVAALETEIKDLLKSHFNLRMQRATQQLNDHSSLKNDGSSNQSGAQPGRQGRL